MLNARLTAFSSLLKILI